MVESLTIKMSRNPVLNAKPPALKRVAESQSHRQPGCQFDAAHGAAAYSATGAPKQTLEARTGAPASGTSMARSALAKTWNGPANTWGRSIP